MKKLPFILVAWLGCLLCGSVLAQPIELPAYGFGDLSTIPVTQSFIHENHIGDAPLESILDYRHNDTYWTIARSVGMLEILLVQGSSEIRTACTATLISEDMILTNAHCIPGNAPNARVVAANLHMGYDQHGLDSTSYPVNIQPLDSDKDLDYSILSVSNSPGERFGFVTLNMRPANPNERLFIIQHAEGLPKRISRNCGFFRDSPIRSINLRHRCDTRGGSSGSLVFSEDDGSVIGLHFASSFREENPPPPAERYNMAKRLDKIFEFSSYLPERISALPTQGYLNVSSNPSGATVKLDGQTIGRTPLQSYAHAIGTYQLSLSYNGYLNHNESIRITANQALQRSVNLRPEAAQRGALNISSSPSGATVALDGRVIGSTPLQNYAYDAGDYQLSLRYNGYQTHSEDIRISAGQTLQRNINLRAEAPPQGSLSISSSPSGATVALDGRVIGNTPLQNYAYAVGDYQLSLRYNGYQTHSETIRISANSLYQRSINLRAEAPAPTPVAPVRPPSQPSAALITTSEELVRRAAQGGRLELAAVTFRLRAPLELRGDVQLIGQGYERTRIVSSAREAVVRYSGGGTFTARGVGFERDGDYGDVVHVTDGNVAMDACQFMGGVLVANSAYWGAGIALKGNSRGTIRNSQVNNNNAGISVSDSAQPQLEQNRIYDNRFTGILYTGSAAGSAVENEIFGNNFGISVWDDATPQLEQNRIYENESTGIFYKGSAAGSAVGNEIFANTYSGIAVWSDAKPQLEQNRIHDNQASGIFYDGTTAGSASNNQIYNNGLNSGYSTGAGITLRESANPTLSNNTFYGNRQGAIRDER